MTMGSVAELALDDGVALRLRFRAGPAAVEPVFPWPRAVGFRRSRVEAQPLAALHRARRAARRLRGARPGAALRDDARAAAPDGAAEMAPRPARTTRDEPLVFAAATSNGRRPADARTAALRRRAPTSISPGAGRRVPPAATRGPAAGLQPAHARMGRGAAPRAAVCRPMRAPRAGSARPHRGPAATATPSSPATTASSDARSTSSGSIASSASASIRLGVRRRDARDRRAGARRHRLPGRRARPVDGYTSCATAMPTPGPSTGRRGRGWVRADPTAAVAPDRVGLSRQLCRGPGSSPGPSAPSSPDAARRPARGLGGGQQPLEPVGAELLARPAARSAEELRLRARAGKTSPIC